MAPAPTDSLSHFTENATVERLETIEALKVGLRAAEEGHTRSAEEAYEDFKRRRGVRRRP